MIILKIDPSKVDDYADLALTKKRNYIPLDEKLKNWIASNPNHNDLEIVKDIHKNIKKILVAQPKELEIIIEQYNNNGYQNKIHNGQLTAFGKELESIFRYNAFRKSKRAVWFAKSSGVKTCTTCNTQYTLTTKQGRNEKLLFHLDHYFPKSVYPYLSLSYFNLIPCCASCNMGKSNKPFKLSENIHPYIDSLHQLAKFNIDARSLAEFLLDPNRNEEKLRYTLDIRTKYYGDKVYNTKLENYAKEFRINEQYELFKDIAAETCLRAKYYSSKSRRDELKKLFANSQVKLDDELINRLILGNYYLDKDLLNRPLAKFMRDIGEDLKII